MPKPFGKIVLSLSGGGVRAVGYHSGVLAYLDHARILEDVSILSTVSGGSLVGLGYATHLKDPALGQTFNDFYTGLRQDLQTHYHFVDHLLQDLDTQYPPSPRNRRYLIAAYADLLNRAFRFFDGRKFEVFFPNAPDTHIEDLIVNSLECYFGEGFRFQHGSLSGMSGNYRVELQDQFVREALLSDIMAASSDLPGAFAPIVFPDDFHWQDDVYPEPWNSPRPICENIQNSIDAQFPGNGGNANTRTVTLIDGGIYDNQGISAVINWMRNSSDRARAAHAFRRLIRWRSFKDDDVLRTLEELGAPRQRCAPRRSYWDRLTSRRDEEDVTTRRQLAMMTDEESETDIGLFIVSDAPEFRGPDPIYAVNNEWETGRWGTSLRTVVRVSFLAVLLGAISLIYTFVRLLFGPPFLATPTIWDLIVLMIMLVVLAVAVIVTGTLLWRFFRTLRTCNNAIGSIWSRIRGLRLRDVRNMGWLRGASVSAVLTNLMPNRIRNQGLDVLVTDPSIIADTVVVNEIDDFMKTPAAGLPSWLVPNAAMVALATSVATMNTRFWLTDPEFEDLVAVGQCTTCYNLLVQLWLRTNLYPRAGDVFDNPLHQQVFDQCRADWNALLVDPRVLLP